MHVTYSAAEAPTQAAPPVAFQADGATADCAASKARPRATADRPGTICSRARFAVRELSGLLYGERLTVSGSLSQSHIGAV